MIKKIILSAALVTTLGSCGIYTKYQPETAVPDSLFGEKVLDQPVTAYEDTTSLGMLSWREVFTDPQLQTLIERGLCQNSDCRQAALRVDEAKATLKAARLAFLPSFAISPQGGVSSFDGAKATQTYSIPLNMSWEIDIFGRMRNAKQQSKALYAKSQDYQQAVYTQLVANISNIYYTLVTLDEQLSISQRTEEAWRETLQTARALMKAGRYDESAVSQMEATLQSVHASVLDLQSQIAQTENSMAILLSETPRHYDRCKAADVSLPESFTVGIPLYMLSARPDVRQAQRTIESAFYGVNAARSAFYPSLTLSGSIGWTNSAGSAIVNPGKFLASALGSIVAPLLTRGQNEAQLRIAKAQQEEARVAFSQTLLNAGKEVNDALTTYQTTTAKEETIASQIRSLQEALRSTTLLMEHGTNTYLEVLTARQTLLSAQLSQSANYLAKAQSVICLYQALGGGQVHHP